MFDANYRSAIKGIRGFASETDVAGAKTQKSLRGMDRSILSINRSMSGIRGREFRVLSLSALRASNSVDRLRGLLLATSTLAGGFGVAFTLKGIADYSDTYKEVGNRLRIVKGHAQDLSAIEEKTFQVAQRSRSQYKATGILFARIANASKRLNISQKDTLRVTETIQKSFLVGGATPVEAAQSSIQLSQGIASNRLQGDELRSVLENPALGQLLADRITDGDLGQLRELAKEGKLTAGVIVRAFSDASEEIDKLFASTQETIGQAFIKVDNALLKYIGTNEGALSGTRATVVALNAIAENMDTVADSVVLLGGAMALLIGARGFGGLSKSIATAIGQMKKTRIEMRASAVETLSLATAQEKVAKSKMLHSRLELNRALNEGLLTTKQVNRLQQKTAKSIKVHRQATANLTKATIDHAAAIRRLTPAGTAAAGAMRGLSASMAFLGGPVGVALIALGGAMYVVSRNAAKLSEASEEAAESIRIAEQEIENVASLAPEAAKGVDALTAGFKKLIKQKDITEALSVVSKLSKGIEGTFSKMYELQRKLSAESGDLAFSHELMLLITQLKVGAPEAANFGDKIDDLAKSKPSLASALSEIKKFGDSVVEDTESLGIFRKEIEKIDGMKAVATIIVHTTGVKALTGVQTEKLKADLKKSAEDFVKTKHEAIKEAFKNSKLDPVTARLYSDILNGVKIKKSKRAQKKSDSERLAERFEKTLDRLAYKATTFDFSNVDKQTVNTARSIGIADDKIRQFIASIEGDGTAPTELQAIQASFQKIADTKFTSELEKLSSTNVVQFLSDLDRETVRTARSFGIAEEEVKKFIASSATGNIDIIPEKIARIRTKLETLATNKRLEEFKDDYANVLGTSLNSLFDSLFDTGKSVDKIMMDAAKSIGKLVFQLLIVEPLVKSFRGALNGSNPFSFGSLVSGGGGGAGPMLLPGIYHAGGDAGNPANRHAVPAGLFNNAPRLHKGLGSKEFTAILEQGERVVTSGQTKTEANVISNLSRLAKSNNPSYAPVFNIDAKGSDMGEAKFRQILTDFDKQSYSKFVENYNKASLKRAI